MWLKNSICQIGTQQSKTYKYREQIIFNLKVGYANRMNKLCSKILLLRTQLSYRFDWRH